MIEWHKAIDKDHLPPMGEWVLVYNKNCHMCEIEQFRLVIVERTWHDCSTGKDETYDELTWQDKIGGLGPVLFIDNDMGVKPDCWAYFNIPEED